MMSFLDQCKKLNLKKMLLLFHILFFTLLLHMPHAHLWLGAWGFLSTCPEPNNGMPDSQLFTLLDSHCLPKCQL